MLTEQVILDTVCGQVYPAVADRIREVAKTRSNPDPNFWCNVMLRESWYVDHGSYDEWDRMARAGGIDPLQFGPDSKEVEGE